MPPRIGAWQPARLRYGAAKKGQRELNSAGAHSQTKSHSFVLFQQLHSILQVAREMVGAGIPCFRYASGTGFQGTGKSFPSFAATQRMCLAGAGRPKGGEGRVGGGGTEEGGGGVGGGRDF